MFSDATSFGMIGFVYRVYSTVNQSIFRSFRKENVCKIFLFKPKYSHVMDNIILALLTMAVRKNNLPFRNFNKTKNGKSVVVTKVGLQWRCYSFSDACSLVINVVQCLFHLCDRVSGMNCALSYDSDQCCHLP